MTGPKTAEGSARWWQSRNGRTTLLAGLLLAFSVGVAWYADEVRDPPSGPRPQLRIVNDIDATDETHGWTIVATIAAHDCHNPVHVVAVISATYNLWARIAKWADETHVLGLKVTSSRVSRLHLAVVTSPYPGVVSSRFIRAPKARLVPS